MNSYPLLIPTLQFVALWFLANLTIDFLTLALAALTHQHDESPTRGERQEHTSPTTKSTRQALE